jgi:DNA polymerase III sliding clamp (beta) subunit (PCNA family)
MVDREQLLQQLECVAPGLSPKDIVEQSSCFVFQDKHVYTYNDEVACSHTCDVGITGAVKADALLKLLRQLPEKLIEVTAEDGAFRVKAKRRQAGITMEADVLLPIDKVEKPKKWKSLAEGFADAIEVAAICASRDESKPAISCVHIHPKYIEATDDFQISRHKLKTGVSEPFLVRPSSIRHIVSLGMTEFSETPQWVHFKNPAGLVLSCRRFIEQFPDIADFLKVEGSKVVFPKGLGDALANANIFSGENVDNDDVVVELRPGGLRVKGTGSSGWYRETKKIAYSGDPLGFKVSPKLLSDLCKKYNEMTISANALLVEGGNFSYVACLGALGE